MREWLILNSRLWIPAWAGRCRFLTNASDQADFSRRHLAQDVSSFPLGEALEMRGPAL
jgi:hypothetical protein